MMKNKLGTGPLQRWIEAAVIAALVLLSATGGFAQTRIITLSEALEIAAQHNRDIVKAREYMAYVQGRYVEERAAAFPQLTATAGWGQDRDESQKIYSPMQTERTDRRNVKIGLSQPLFTWGQVSAAIRAAEVGLKSAEEQIRLYRQAALMDVSAAFYDVLLARDLYELALQNLEQKRRHLDEARRKHQAGVATDYDVLAAEVTVENARPETVRTQNQVRTRRDRLRFLLALEGEIDVAGSLEPRMEPCLNYEEAVALAKQRRPDLADLRHRIAMYEERVRVTAAQDKPRVDLKADYGWSYLEQPGGIYGDGPSWSMGVQLTYPFFDGMRTKGRVAQAQSDLRSLRIDEAKQTDRIALDTQDAVNAVREAQEILRSLGGTLSQAQRLLAMAEQGFVLGVKTRLDVEDAELNLRQARSGLSRARRDYIVSRVNLEWVTGILGEPRP